MAVVCGGVIPGVRAASAAIGASENIRTANLHWRAVSIEPEVAAAARRAVVPSGSTTIIEPGVIVANDCAAVPLMRAVNVEWRVVMVNERAAAARRAIADCAASDAEKRAAFSVSTTRPRCEDT